MDEGGSDTIDVLHVDDDPAILELTSDVLAHEEDDITVETALSADRGLDVLSREAVDCIVSDYEMPERDGLDFLKTVREDDPVVPFILYTGKGSEEVASEAISAGVTDYVQKQPGLTQYELLVNRIRNAVSRYRSQRKIAEQRAQYQRLFEDAPVMYAVTRNRDGEPIVDECNQWFLDRLGYSSDEVIGEPLASLYTDDSAAALLDGGGYRRSLEGSFTREERAFQTADGERLEAVLRAVPRVDEDGDVVGTLTLYVDF